MQDRNCPPKRWVWLTELIQRHGWTSGVEVGVKAGENLFYLLDHNPSLTMHGVDPWSVQADAQETYAEWQVEDLYREVAERAGAYEGRCILHRDYSVPAAEYVPDTDFVFIDAQHTYEDCLADIAAWRGKCLFLAGHDYWDVFPGIERAVAESFASDEIILGPNTCWAVWLGR
jgi:hypothetical protein